MLKFVYLTLFALFSVSQAYYIRMYSETDYGNEIGKYNTLGTHDFSGTAHSYIADLNGSNRCVQFCYSGTDVGYLCANRDQPKSSGGIGKIIIYTYGSTRPSC
jgi:hypothetical protein